MKTQENQTVTLSDGRKLGYAEYGELGGKPLFFFHGWPSSRLQARVIDEVAKNLRVRVISLDRPGYGLSDFKKDRTLLDWSDDVVEVADKLKIKKFAVIGVSGGGPYSVVCAYKIPERLTNVGIVVGLAPTNIDGVLQGMAFFNKLAWRSYHTFPFLMELTSSIHLAQARKYLPDSFSFTYRAKADRAMMSEKVKEDIANNRNEAFRQGKQGCAMDLKLYTDDWGFRIKDIKAKVFLWYGDADRNVSVKMGRYYASQIPNSKLTIYSNEGHFVIKTHAEDILRTLQLSTD